jgi:hypothetical protein
MKRCTYITSPSGELLAVLGELKFTYETKENKLIVTVKQPVLWQKSTEVDKAELKGANQWTG